MLLCYRLGTGRGHDPARQYDTGISKPQPAALVSVTRRSSRNWRLALMPSWCAAGVANTTPRVASTASPEPSPAVSGPSRLSTEVSLPYARRRAIAYNVPEKDPSMRTSQYLDRTVKWLKWPAASGAVLLLPNSVLASLDLVRKIVSNPKPVWPLLTGLGLYLPCWWLFFRRPVFGTFRRPWNTN